MRNKNDCLGRWNISQEWKRDPASPKMLPGLGKVLPNCIYLHTRDLKTASSCVRAVCCLCLNNTLKLFHRRVHLELALASHGVFACRLPCNTAKDNTVQKGITAETIVTMNSSSNLACSVESWHNTPRTQALSICCDLEPTHAIVDHGSDDGHVERLIGNLRTRNDVVVKLL